MNICQIEQIRNFIQTSHINFLFGSGLSCPFLSTLNSIETLLTEAQLIQDDVRKIVETSLLVKYFNTVMRPCLCNEMTEEAEYAHKKVVSVYETFLSTWNAIMAHRDTSLLEKTINIFTTNIDNLVEKAAEKQRIEFNDGFKGHLAPTFREDSFNNVLTKISPLYLNLAHIPIFNYIKIHGSINWIEMPDGNTITYDGRLELIRKIKEAVDVIPSGQLVKVLPQDTIQTLEIAAKNLIDSEDYVRAPEVESFRQTYMKLVMIHPRKAKFKESVIDSHFYELMRRYSNSLEMANSLLFVTGFSFADEHITKITVRAANTNPTLQIIVFAFCESEIQKVESNLAVGGRVLNNNILIVSPNIYYRNQNESEQKSISKSKAWTENIFEPDMSNDQDISLRHKFTLEVLNEVVFKRLLATIE